MEYEVMGRKLDEIRERKVLVAGMLEDAITVIAGRMRRFLGSCDDGDHKALVELRVSLRYLTDIWKEAVK